MRSVMWKVVFWNDTQGREDTLFESPFMETSEAFCSGYDGGQKEIYLKKVWALTFSRKGHSEL